MKVRPRLITISLLLCIVMFTVSFSVHTLAFEVTEMTAKGIVVTASDDLNVRQGPGTTYDRVTTVPKDSVVDISGTAKDEEDNVWYRISANGYTGFVLAKYITVFEIPDSPDEEFELMISQFPESYKEDLRILHALHPTWRFTPLVTNITWETLMKNECVIGRNLLQSPDAWKSFEDGAYNWETNTWYSFDSGSWQQACTEVISYYMDPRNFLDGNIYQFLVLSDDGSEVSPDVINEILKGTFMYSAACGDGMTYADAIVKAAKEAGASPYMLAARIRLEQGSVGNKLAHGTVSGYEGYYNHFDIGAYQHSGRSAIENGAIYAKNRGWDTPYKAILGGASFLVKNYISVGQNTLYLQKFDIVDGGNGFYNHQYMTNTRAAVDECASLRTAISGSPAENSALTFLIPVFGDMPETPQQLPLTTGSANNLLTSLSVEGFAFTTEFNKYTNEYELFIEENEITVNAAAMHKDATVEGTGKFYLHNGINVIPITVTASNTNKRVYTIYVTCTGESSPNAPTPTPTPQVTPTPTHNNTAVPTQGASSTAMPSSTATSSPTPTPTPAPVFETTYTVRDNVIIGIDAGTLLSKFKEGITVKGYTVTYTDSAGNTKNDTHVMETGDIITLSLNGKAERTVYVAVRGDSNGDGRLSLADLLKTQRHILGIQALDKVYLAGADFTLDGELRLADLLQCQKAIMDS